MREKLRDKGRIEDIIKYSDNIRQMIDGVTYEQFLNNILIYYAVMKNVEIVGEAAYMLSAEFKEAHYAILYVFELSEPPNISTEKRESIDARMPAILNNV